MKIKISYFYQIRFFQPYQIPISTALSDPDWYHDYQGKKHVFLDKRGVINGLRIPILQPTTSECAECVNKTPENCLFLKHYYEHLKTIDFKLMLEQLHDKFKLAEANEKFGDKLELILIVHESPKNKCSEREMLIKWFNENNYPLEEFHK